MEDLTSAANPQSTEQGIAGAEAEVMLCLAVGDGCADCSAANFAPRRLGDAVAKERISTGTVEEFARRLRDCPGILEEAGVKFCRLPSES